MRPKPPAPRNSRVINTKIINLKKLTKEYASGGLKAMISKRKGKKAKKTAQAPDRKSVALREIMQHKSKYGTPTILEESSKQLIREGRAFIRHIVSKDKLSHKQVALALSTNTEAVKRVKKNEYGKILDDLDEDKDICYRYPTHVKKIDNWISKIENTAEHPSPQKRVKIKKPKMRIKREHKTPEEEEEDEDDSDSDDMDNNAFVSVKAVPGVEDAFENDSEDEDEQSSSEDEGQTRSKTPAVKMQHPGVCKDRQKTPRFVCIPPTPPASGSGSPKKSKKRKAQKSTPSNGSPKAKRRRVGAPTDADRVTKFFQALDYLPGYVQELIAQGLGAKELLFLRGRNEKKVTKHLQAISPLKEYPVKVEFLVQIISSAKAKHWDMLYDD